MNIVIVSNNPNYVEGSQILNRTKPGTFVKVIDHKSDDTKKDEQSIQKTLLRTDDNESPFVELESGKLWGNKVSNYTFQILHQRIIELQ